MNEALFYEEREGEYRFVSFDELTEEEVERIGRLEDFFQRVEIGRMILELALGEDIDSL